MAFDCRVESLNGDLRLKNTPVDTGCIIIGTVREYLLKKFFSTFFWNFDLEISRFCHSDTLKNEISWTLTDDKKNFKSHGSEKNFLRYCKNRAFNRTNSQGHTTSRKVATSLFRKKSSATWGPKITTFK